MNFVNDAKVLGFFEDRCGIAPSTVPVFCRNRRYTNARPRTASSGARIFRQRL